MTDRSTPGGPGDAVSVTVPSWAVTDWSLAALIAVRTVLTFIVVGFLVLAATVLILLIRVGATDLDLGTLLGTAFSLPLVYLGAYQETPVLLTGIFVLVFSLRRSVRVLPLPPFEADRVRMFALAGKVAIVSVVLLLVDAIVMDTLDLLPAGGLGSGLGLIQTFAIDYVRLVFITGPVVGVFALFQIAKRSNSSVTGGAAWVRIPGMVTTSWLGVKRTLRIALIGLLVLFAVGSILETLTFDFGEFSQLAGAILSLLLLVVVFVAVDVAALFFVVAMSFLQFETLGTQSAWEWAGVALVAVAFFLGGRAAAQKAAPTTVAEAVTAASLIGVLLSGVGILVAINYQGLAGQEGFAAPAILLPLLWTIPALVGAWWYASEQRLPSGVAVSVVTTAPSQAPTVHSAPESFSDADQSVQESRRDDAAETAERHEVADAPPPLAGSSSPTPQVTSAEASSEPADWRCASCGAENQGGHKFCSSCGTPAENTG